MAGLAAAATLAVSVAVTGPAPTLPPQQWVNAGETSLAAVVAQWGAEGNIDRFEIPSEVGQMRIGRLNVNATDVCAAVGRLVASLRYTTAQPRLAECNASAGRLVISSALAK